MNIPQSTLEPFGYTGIPILVHDIEHELFAWWVLFWDDNSKRGVGIESLILRLKLLVRTYGGTNEHVLFDNGRDEHPAMMTVIYKLRTGNFQSVRLRFP